MDQEFANRINEEIEPYKNALLHDAKQCEWQSFKSKAGMLFDSGILCLQAGEDANTGTHIAYTLVVGL